MNSKTEDLRILEVREVITPEEAHFEYPLPLHLEQFISDSRFAIHNILKGNDDRLIAIVGPCSIHDPKAAMEYAKLIQEARDKFERDLCIIMRVYFEKPRTTVGWKGLINDPGLDDSYQINDGLRIARKLLVDINDLGVPAGTEFLDLITPQYLADLVTWGAIGARTTESQVHRELASGLSCPVGFKNGTDGTLKVASDAIRAANRSHCFLSLTKKGHSAIFTTAGNEDCHIILRGGKQPNYDREHVDQAALELQRSGLDANIMIDFSHANSNKQYIKQLEVGNAVAQQIADGDNRIIGVMIESHLVEGRQEVVPGKALVYGQSITDACINWEQTYGLLEQLAQAAQSRRKADK